MLNHTPGPWKKIDTARAFCDTGDVEGETNIFGRDGSYVMSSWRDDDHSSCDCRLIEAAPDMLFLLRSVATRTILTLNPETCGNALTADVRLMDKINELINQLDKDEEE